MTEYTYAECRVYGHAWSEVELVHDFKKSAIVRVECLRCETERRDVVKMSTGQVVHRVYKYPPGYVTPGRKFRADVRRSLYFGR